MVDIRFTFALFLIHPNFDVNVQITNNTGKQLFNGNFTNLKRSNTYYN